MAQSDEDFDFETVIKSYTLQDLAIGESLKLRSEAIELYSEILKETENLSEECLREEQKYNTLRAGIAGNLNAQNMCNQLNTTANEKSSVARRRVLDHFKDLTRDSDEYVNNINEIISKIDTLETEFNEQLMMNKMSNIFESCQKLEHSIATAEETYKREKENFENFEVNPSFEGIQKLRKFLDKSDGFERVRMEFRENCEIRNLINKNIEFLTRRSCELSDGI